MAPPALLAAATGAALGLCVLTACAVSDPPTKASTQPFRTLVDLPFDKAPGQNGDEENQGLLEVRTRMVTASGGSVSRVSGRDGGSALRFPAYDPSGDGALSILRVDSPDGGDALTPGSSDFAFGATFRLDAVSHGSRADDGDNLLQLGRYGDAAQYKLDLDGRSPACRVKGDLGALQVKTASPVNAEDWYKVTCQRAGTTVTLTLIRYLADGSTCEWSRSVTGSTGSVTADESGARLSVGGKLDGSGRIDASSDQFNGEVDEIFVRIRE